MSLPPLRQKNWPLIWLLLVFLGLTFLVIWQCQGRENLGDERLWHMPAVRQIASHWPAVDLQADSFSACPPGYHWLLAGLSKLTGTDLTTIRVWNALLSGLILVVLSRWLGARVVGGDVFLLALPLAASSYVVKSGAWLLTDNAGLLGALATFLCLLPRQRDAENGVKHSIWASILASLTIAVRQINAWVMCSIFVEAVMTERVTGGCRFSVGLLHRLLWLLLPTALLGFLVISWGGLVPPQWRGQGLGVSTCPLAYVLSMAAVFLPCFIPGEGRWQKQLKNSWREVTMGALIGLSAAIVSASSPSVVDGRWGGMLWSIAAHLPVIADRSVMFVLLAPLGGGLVALSFRLIFAAGRPIEAWVWLASVGTWAISLMASRQVFQRYYEPSLLMFGAVALTLCSGESLGRHVRLKLGVLGLAQIVITWLTTVRGTALL